jgi:phosphatidyl-myo-inositol dimannoside synthase
LKPILIISSEFPPLPGGIGNHALHLAMNLQKSKKKVTVITDQRNEILKTDLDFDSKQSFIVKRIKRKKIVFLTYFKRISETFSFIKNNKEASIICSGKFQLWLGAFLKVMFSTRNFLAVVHGSEIFAGGKYSQKLTKWSFSKFDTLIAVSEFTKKLILDKNSNLEVTVINNGFLFSEIEIPNSDFKINGNPKIVTIGNVTFRKGQQNVIKALPKLKEKFPEIQYHIVGIPTEKDTFESLAKSLNVEDNCTFYGALSDIEMMKIVSNSDVFLMLSENLPNGDVEGFGIAILEANYFGLPAIGSKSSGIADAIKHNYSGKLVNPNNEIEILEALTEIMENYQKYSEQAKLWSLNFDWKIVIQKYLEIID